MNQKNVSFMNVQISCVVSMHVIYIKEEDVNLIDVIFLKPIADYHAVEHMGDNIARMIPIE